MPFLNASQSLMDLPEEPVQLRVLQAVVTLLTTTYELHGETLASALVVCFKLYESKTPSVASTASASLRQAVSLLFDCARREQEAPPNAAPITLSSPPPASPSTALASPRPSTAAPPAAPAPAAAANGDAPARQTLYQNDACALLRDLCALSGGDAATWLPLPKLPRNLGLELIEICLGSYVICAHARMHIYTQAHKHTHIHTRTHLRAGDKTDAPKTAPERGYRAPTHAMFNTMHYCAQSQRTHTHDSPAARSST